MHGLPLPHLAGAGVRAGKEQRVVADPAEVGGDDTVDVAQRVLGGAEQLRGAADAVRLLQRPGARGRAAHQGPPHPAADVDGAGMTVGPQQVGVEEARVAAEEVGQQAGERGERTVGAAHGVEGQGGGRGGDGRAVDQGESVASVQGEGAQPGGGQRLAGRHPLAVQVGVAPAAQGLGGVGERDEVAARADGAVAGDGGREGGGEHRGEPVDHLGRHARKPLGEGTGAQQQRGADDPGRKVRALAGAEVGQGVVALVGVVGAAGVADEGAESGVGAVDPAVRATGSVPQRVEETAPPGYAGADLLVHRDGEGERRAAQGGGVQGAGERDGVRGCEHTGERRPRISERSEIPWLPSVA